MNAKSLLLGLVAGGMVGAGAGGWLLPAQPQSSQGTQAATPATVQPQPLFYRNPMNPAITSPVPAQDEMGMDYIPVYADSEGGDHPVEIGRAHV